MRAEEWGFVMTSDETGFVLGISLYLLFAIVYSVAVWRSAGRMAEHKLRRIEPDRPWERR